jgi:hypothetical protein
MLVGIVSLPRRGLGSIPNTGLSFSVRDGATATVEPPVIPQPRICAVNLSVCPVVISPQPGF